VAVPRAAAAGVLPVGGVQHLPLDSEHWQEAEMMGAVYVLLSFQARVYQPEVWAQASAT
jgi:phospholipase C